MCDEAEKAVQGPGVSSELTYEVSDCTIQYCQSPGLRDSISDRAPKLRQITL